MKEILKSVITASIITLNIVNIANAGSNHHNNYNNPNINNKDVTNISPKINNKSNNNIKNDIGIKNNNKNSNKNTNKNLNANLNANLSANFNKNDNKINSSNKNVNLNGSISGAAAKSTSDANANSNSRSDANNSNSNLNEGNSVYINHERNVASAYAPNIVSSNDTCMGSISAGGQGASFGISLGSTYTDNDCILRKDARLLYNMGLKETAIHLLCSKDSLRDALVSSNIGCPNVTIQDVVVIREPKNQKRKCQYPNERNCIK